MHCLQESQEPLLYPRKIQKDEACGADEYLYRLPPHNFGDGQIIVMRAGNHDQKNFADLRRKLDPKKLDPGLQLQYKERCFTKIAGVENKQFYRYKQEHFIQRFIHRLSPF